MIREVKPLAADIETNLRERLAHNPFVMFMGVKVPELGEGYARFTLEIRPDFHNSQGFLQGGDDPRVVQPAGVVLEGDDGGVWSFAAVERWQHVGGENDARGDGDIGRPKAIRGAGAFRLLEQVA